MWLGATCGWVLCGSVFASVLWGTDWGEEARKVVAVQGQHAGRKQATAKLDPDTISARQTRPSP